MTIHILGISGSLRRNSTNRALLRTAQAVAPPDVTIEIADLHDIPLFNVDVEAEGMPEAVLAFRDRIRAADALIFATPEYNWSIPGVLKNAIDWASRKGLDPSSPLDGKPAAIMSAAGMSGGMRAQMHLREILQHNDLRVLNRPSLMIARAAQYFEDGRLVDPNLRARLARQLAALRDWALQFHPELAQRLETAVSANGYDR